ncbi:uroporphyrinogen-III C-methyltransferase [Ignavigranum ruoffiae]|uniref:Uroporphyrinogen-III C-methyltransferase n=1 Tax=Ignavigranum ruoffiae TaxID=89093 RepID=A0A1H9CFC0_9LACT|nr:uroporphyrinogen-III C-methyltransferase [Ignavigranum ruoffiae]SEP99859.1 uroporphyrinogen III methyltransferase / synthase [Ignavigranum ruoffiae]
MNTNKVYIVGAGTGRIENLTVKAKNLIEKADIIFYDRLINDNLLMLTKSDCKKVYVGKNPNGKATSQDTIINQLIDAVQHFPVVLRLKSGDPYIFGRGGEEAKILYDKNIPFEVVPGISSSMGGLTYAGIPITYRDIALDFHVFTGHAKDGEAKHDWKSISQLKGTLVFMMGVKHLKNITESLIKNGKDPQTPVAIIEWASRSHQKLIIGDLKSIYVKALKAQIQPPSLIIVGKVVNFNDSLNYFMRKPLFGFKIAIPQSQSRVLLPLLEDYGAEVIMFSSPIKRIKTINLSERALSSTLYFLDISSVDSFINWMIEEKKDWRQLASLKIVSVGNHTYHRFKEIGIQPNENIENLISLQKKKMNGKEIYLASEETSQQLQYIIKSFNMNNVIITSQEEFNIAENSPAIREVDAVIYSNTKAVRSMLRYEEYVDYKTIPSYCLGNQSKKMLEDLEFKTIYMSEEGTYESLMELLISQVPSEYEED